MAFGNLKFDTLTTSDAVGTSTEKSVDTSYVFNCVAKAFIFGNQTTAVKSFNMSGTTDHGTGNYTYSFTNNMSDANWLISHEAGLEGETYGLYLEDLTTGKTSSTIRFQTMSISNTLQDASEVQQICFGDLA
tara:strand:+ start:138 stop:533 length:396 start_codon:yes stop_codon:yes gene_type:complete